MERKSEHRAMSVSVHPCLLTASLVLLLLSEPFFFFLPELRKVIPTTTTVTHGLKSFDIFVSFGR